MCKHVDFVELTVPCAELHPGKTHPKYTEIIIVSVLSLVLIIRLNFVREDSHFGCIHIVYKGAVFIFLFLTHMHMECPNLTGVRGPKKQKNASH